MAARSMMMISVFDTRRMIRYVLDVRPAKPLPTTNRKPGEGRLGDLESVILGIVAKFGPCTAYTVRTHFESSPTAFFSSSPGSVYPAVKRLCERSLLAPEEDARGRQARVRYTVTAAGRASLRAWLSPPFPDEALAVPYDPIRNRLYFLTTLPSARRRRVVDELIAALEEHLPRVQTYVDSFDPDGRERMSHLAARGCLYAARAQLRWLREVRDELGAP